MEKISEMTEEERFTVRVHIARVILSHTPMLCGMSAMNEVIRQIGTLISSLPPIDIDTINTSLQMAAIKAILEL